MDLILLIFPNTTGVEDASAVSRVITGYLASDIQSLALLQLCVCVCVCGEGGGGEMKTEEMNELGGKKW